MVDKKLVVDVSKGTSAYIDLTPEEIEQRAVDAQASAIDAAAAEIERQEREAAAEAEADAKLSAQAKLQALGLSGDEIAAITK
jgi:hypothetical protein